MTKEELLNITLDQLLDAFHNAPECLELYDKDIEAQLNTTGPIIKWSFKINMNGRIIDDPNNTAKTIVVNYNTITKSMHCNIYLRDINPLSYQSLSDADVHVVYGIPYLHKSYRKFYKLRAKLLKRHRNKENDKYLNKLMSVFPATFDDGLLK